MSVHEVNLKKGVHLFTLTIKCNIKSDDLNMKSKYLIESTFIEIMITKWKNMIMGCICQNLKQRIHNALMDKLSREKEDILIMNDFNIKLLNYNNDKDTTTFHYFLTLHHYTY